MPQVQNMLNWVSAGQYEKRLQDEEVPSRQDMDYHLHSQTNPASHLERGPLLIERGSGARVYDSRGNEYIDAMSGLWSASLGFANARLARVAAAQYEKLGFYHTFFHRSSAAVGELSAKLVALTGLEGGKAYFATSGSEANETMVKLAWLYHTVRGKPSKRKVIARDRAFHGSTIAAASMCGLPAMHREFGLPLPGFLHVSAPFAYRGMLNGEGEAGFVERLGVELERTILREGPDTIAAFIAEPIYAGGGIIVPPEGYFRRIQEVLAKYDILCLDDEVVCGFGRTGHWFGKDRVGMSPDMMSLAKGLSSSHFPISAVVISQRVFEAVVEFNRRGGVFGHGFTNSGHPVGVAVALETIKIYEEDDIVANSKRQGERLRRHFERLAGKFDMIGEVRGSGLMLAIQLTADWPTRAAFPPAFLVGLNFDRIAYGNGLISRSMLGDALGFAPPLIVTDDDVDEIARRCEKSLSQLEEYIGSQK